MTGTRRGTVVLSDEALNRAEHRVLSVLEQAKEPYPPRQLIDELESDPELTEPLLRAAIWYLIDRYAVELTRDRQLRVPANVGVAEAVPA
jgi:hypothetical protein